MFRTLHDHLWRRLPLLNWIAVACAFCLAVLAGRMELSGRTSFVFLSWNLLLAVLPLCFAWAAHGLSRTRLRPLALLVLVPWLLFLPNAPYILTDLLHLKHRAPVPMWYDLLMLLSFALTGLFLGYLSLRHAEAALRAFVRPFWARTCIVLSLFLSAFGIYLGRFLRWNSWDVLTDPYALALDVVRPVLHPFRYDHVWLMTGLLGVLLVSGYHLVRGVGAVGEADR
jgi:uncharacterized membrane protein